MFPSSCDHQSLELLGWLLVIAMGVTSKPLATGVAGNAATDTIATGLRVEDLSQFNRNLSEKVRQGAMQADLATRLHMRSCHRMVPVHENLLIRELDLAHVLKRIERGELRLDQVIGEMETFIGEHMFRATDPEANNRQWLFYVFVDNGEWDYLDCAIAPNGSLYFNRFSSGLDFYRPPPDALKLWHL